MTTPDLKAVAEKLHTITARGIVMRINNCNEESFYDRKHGPGLVWQLELIEEAIAASYEQGRKDALKRLEE